MSWLRKHAGPVALSVLFHGLIIALLVYGVDLSRDRPVRPTPSVSIQATVLDSEAIAAEAERLEELEREREAQRLEREQQEADRLQALQEEAERLEAEQAQRREEAEQERIRLEQEQREAEAAAEAERERLAELERQRQEEEARQEQERIAREEAERKRLEEEARREEERRAAEEAERRRREEEERIAREREAEERRQREAMEAELREALAAEETRQTAVAAGLLDQYVREIQQRVERNWNRPPGAGVGLSCQVTVRQLPSGDVIDVRIGACNGDATVVRSIEAAVLKASPLPTPPDPSLFERNLIFVFEPDE